MVKICPNCKEKNFDDSKRCMKCNAKIKKVITQPDEPLSDEFPDFKPLGYHVDYAVRNFFSIPGIIFAIISFFIIPIIFIPMAFTFGSLGVIKSDKFGYIAIILGVISILLMLLF